MFWIIIASFAVLIAVAIAIYLMPTDAAAKKKKEKKDRSALMPDPLSPKVPEKDWKVIAERWEKNNNGLLGDLEKLKMREKSLLKECDEHKAHNKELMDKLGLEKGWREKEQVNTEKARHHEKELKDQIIRTEKDLEKEHSQRLTVERELQELKIKHDAAVEERRLLATKAASLETTVSQLSVELKSLRRDNDELKKKREDIQWVAKSEYDELARKFKELQDK